MSDDLVKRLRAMLEGNLRPSPLGKKAADRIEELEAKMAKAVESLIRIDDLTCHNMPMTAREEQGVNREARAALKELQDKTDD